MERNKLKSGFYIYVMLMQLIITVIGMSFLGVYVGQKLNADSNLSWILGAVGLFLGLIMSFITLYQFIKSEANYERRIRR